jgi:hypothetical protein
MINNRLKWHLDNLNILPKAQTGFRKGCTTTENLIRIESSIKSGFNTNCPKTAIFLDIAKAYDNAWIEGILLKLAKANVWQKLVAKNTLGIDCSLPLEKQKKTVIKRRNIIIQIRSPRSCKGILVLF